MKADEFKELQGAITGRELAIKLGVTEQTILNWRKWGCPERRDAKVRRVVKQLARG